MAAWFVLLESASKPLNASSNHIWSTVRDQDWPRCCSTLSNLQTSVRIQPTLFIFCFLDVRLDFYKHIVLSGGTTMYPGLPSRLEREIKQLYFDRIAKGKPEQFEVRISLPSPKKVFSISISIRAISAKHHCVYTSLLNRSGQLRCGGPGPSWPRLRLFSMWFASANSSNGKEVDLSPPRKKKTYVRSPSPSRNIIPLNVFRAIKLGVMS